MGDAARDFRLLYKASTRLVQRTNILGGQASLAAALLISPKLMCAPLHETVHGLLLQLADLSPSALCSQSATLLWLSSSQHGSTDRSQYVLFRHSAAEMRGEPREQC